MRFFILSLAVLGLVACEDTIRNHGWVGERHDIESLEAGKAHVLDVEKKLGAATFSSSFGKERKIYYIASQTVQGVSFLRPRLLRYAAYGLSFDEKGYLVRVENVSDDVVFITPTSRETPTVGRERSLLERGLTNIGRVGA